ncbi:thymidine kinase [Mobilitalea sibirica]|uniref:Thymidine kinase n=1 Tax=Mobilitalea sibirica TaxID=1462919 RepID=A0A8J7L017_9FIRM|nr:thymidine kinase [Mobilitalea sibirica]MBH1941403.1 thymidine kinase [Mobilitalea sibirica]
MAKLYFKYGVMGSSKTAQALITKFNYEERGMKVWLIKPQIDSRDGEGIIKSRIGLSSKAYVLHFKENVYDTYKELSEPVDVIIVDECQFMSEDQVNQLSMIVIDYKIPVLCFGLRTDFRTKMFPGSKRLLEIADSITEIKTICSCGKKATVNVRMDENGKIITEGEQILIGGNDRYTPMCYQCFIEGQKNQSKNNFKFLE